VSREKVTLNRCLDWHENLLILHFHLDHTSPSILIIHAEFEARPAALFQAPEEGCGAPPYSTLHLSATHIPDKLSLFALVPAGGGAKKVAGERDRRRKYKFRRGGELRSPRH